MIKFYDMKTLSIYQIRVYVIALLNIFTLNLSAQQHDSSETKTVELDTVTIASNKQEFESMVSSIAYNRNFKYRKTLRKSRVTKRKYIFSNREISETRVLKHFKKAAGKSESADEFKEYFLDRNLTFINVLDGKIIFNLYMTMRETTLNGYLDELHSIFGPS